MDGKYIKADTVLPYSSALNSILTWDIMISQWLLVNLGTIWLKRNNSLSVKEMISMKLQFQMTNLLLTSDPPKYSNSNSPNILLWFFCLIRSRANRARITQPFLNPNLIFFSNAPQIVCRRIIKKNQNKDLENLNSNILEVPMSRTS